MPGARGGADGRLGAAHVDVDHLQRVGRAHRVHAGDVEDDVAAAHALGHRGLVERVAADDLGAPPRLAAAASERARATTSSPRSRSALSSAPPRKPLPPVRKTFIVIARAASPRTR